MITSRTDQTRRNTTQLVVGLDSLNTCQYGLAAARKIG
jgi:hypothetical protein